MTRPPATHEPRAVTPRDSHNLLTRFIGVALCAALVGFAGCARFQPNSPADSSNDYGVTGMEQSFTMKDSNVHYDPAVLAIGTAQSQVRSAYGEPNALQYNAAGQLEEVYAFNPDGTKFVDPQVRPRNIAAAVFTMGTSVAVRQARLHLAEKKLTLFHVIYGPNNMIQSVTTERMGDAPQTLPTAQSSPAM
jgi:hypothetical protein